jgi:coenzyme F420 hydrogenase subunit alpha
MHGVPNVSKTLQISPTTRHEGHSKLVLNVNEEGIIERGNWFSVMPVRGMENIAIGKTMEQVPKIASRVCGICPVAHTLAATEAIEASIGVEIPVDAYLLRVILQCANRLQSHALHNILCMPDLYFPGSDRKINPFSREEPVRSVYMRIQRIREIGQVIAEIAGGEAIHPSNIRIGGMYHNISVRAKLKIMDLVKEANPLVKAQMEFMIAVLRDFKGRDWTEIGGREVPIPKNLGFHDQGCMATDMLYGSSSRARFPAWDPERYSEIQPSLYYMGDLLIDVEDPGYPLGGTTPVGTRVNPAMEACNGIPLYNGQPVEVGPRARMARFRGFDEKGTIGQQVARQMEYMDDVYQMLTHLDALHTSGRVTADTIPMGDGKTRAWATNEAPRGTNVHFARVQEGKIRDFSMIVPTTWNFPVCSMALTGAPWQLAEVVIRGYDPCVSCATHMIVIDEDRKVVTRKRLQ